MHTQTVQFSGFAFDDYNIIPYDVLEKSDSWPSLYGVCLVVDTFSGGKAFGICDVNSYIYSDSLQGFHKMPPLAELTAMSDRCSFSFLNDVIKMSLLDIMKARGVYSVEGLAR